MKLTRVSVEGFRAYNRRVDFDCSADAVILVGPNGCGKTSFFDAIAWCLFGEIRRLRGSRDAVGDDYVANRFASERTPEVTLHFSDKTRTASVTRRGSEIIIIDAGEEVQGKNAEQWIVDLVRGVNLPREATVVDAERVFTRCYLLGQEQIAVFLRQTSPRERFDALSSLLGVDLVRSFYSHEQRVAEQLQAEREGLRADLLKLNNREEAVRTELDRLTSAVDTRRRLGLKRVQAEFLGLTREAREVLERELEVPAGDTVPEVVAAVENLVARLKAAERTTTRRVGESRRLVEEWPALEDMTSRLREISEERREVEASLSAQIQLVRANAAKLQDLHRDLQGIEQRIAELRQDQGEFSSFLLLARTHVKGDRCPVCEQGIDPARVVRRLEDRLRHTPQEIQQLSQQRESMRSKASTLAKIAGEAQASEARLRDKITKLQQDAEYLARDAEAIRRRASALSPELAMASDKSLFEDVHKTETSKLERLHPLLQRIEQLLIEAQYLVSRDHISKLLNEQRDLQKRKAALSDRESILATALSATEAAIQQAKVAEREIVKELLDAQRPLLNALYQRLRPHPVLDQLRVEYGQFAKRGEVYFRASSGDTQANVSTDFSSAQLNAVAVCIFLSFNLSQRGSQLDLVFLDDPIQNMDDFNVLGLLDLLRGFVPSRQVILVTHDVELGDLIQRKLRPLSPGGRTAVHRFTTFGSSGPLIETEIDTYRSEPDLLRAVAG